MLLYLSKSTKLFVHDFRMSAIRSKQFIHTFKRRKGRTEISALQSRTRARGQRLPSTLPCSRAA